MMLNKTKLLNRLDRSPGSFCPSFPQENEYRSACRASQYPVSSIAHRRGTTARDRRTVCSAAAPSGILRIFRAAALTRRIRPFCSLPLLVMRGGRCDHADLRPLEYRAQHFGLVIQRRTVDENKFDFAALVRRHRQHDLLNEKILIGIHRSNMADIIGIRPWRRFWHRLSQRPGRRRSCATTAAIRSYWPRSF